MTHMLAKDLLSDIVVALKPADNARFALKLMDEFRVFHLPLVHDNQLIGLVSDQALYGLTNLEEPLSAANPPMVRAYVYKEQHFYDVIRLMDSEQLSVVPVLDARNQYSGCITLGRLAGLMAAISSVSQPGGIIVIEIDNQSYALSEIARIVESNDAKVLSSYITSFPDSSRLQLTLKVNLTDPSSIIQTLNRYNYVVAASFSEESKISDLLERRYEGLMNYLKM